jgi:hypothetical protein
MAKKREGAGIKKAAKQQKDGFYTRNLVVDIAAIDDETYYLSRKMIDAFRECIRKLFSEIVWGLIATGDVRRLEIPDEARVAAEAETAKRKEKSKEDEDTENKKKLKRQKWGQWRAVTVPNYQLLREMMCRVFDIHGGTAQTDEGGSPGKKYYEFKGRFFQLWDDMRVADPDLPVLGYWIWDGLIQRFTAILDGTDSRLKVSDLWLIMRGAKPFKGFMNFGMGFVTPNNHRLERLVSQDVHAKDENRYVRTALRRSRWQVSFKINDDRWLTYVIAGTFMRNGKLNGKTLDPGARAVLDGGLRNLVKDSIDPNGYRLAICPILSLNDDNRLQMEWPYYKKYVPPSDLIDDAYTCVDIHPGTYIESRRTASGELVKEQTLFIAGIGYNRDGTTMKGKGYRSHWQEYPDCQHMLQQLNRYGMEHYQISRAIASAKGIHDWKTVHALSERCERLTARRAGFVKDQNHKLSAFAVGLAKKWRTGRFVVQFPAAALEEVDEETKKKAGEGGWEPTRKPKELLLHGLKWNWSQLKKFLEYKAKSAGFKVELRESSESDAFVPLTIEEENKEKENVEEEAVSAAGG